MITERSYEKIRELKNAIYGFNPAHQFGKGYVDYQGNLLDEHLMFRNKVKEMVGDSEKIRVEIHIKKNPKTGYLNFSIH